MTLLNFTGQYPDELSCHTAFKAYRDQTGAVCPRYGGKDHYWKSDREQYECKKCGARQTLRRHTVLKGILE
jgi:Zn ribbon nucleic-acid-binding protein